MSVAQSILAKKKIDAQVRDFNPIPLEVTSVEFLHVGAIHLHGSFSGNDSISLCHKFLSLNTNSQSNEIIASQSTAEGMQPLGSYPVEFPKNSKPSIKETHEMKHYVVICFIHGMTTENQPFWGYYAIDGRMIPKLERILRHKDVFDLHRIASPFYESNEMPEASRLMFNLILAFDERKTNLVVFPAT